MFDTGILVDLFAGAGGASCGVEAALGADIDIAINHNPVALAVHAANHPRAVHLVTDVWDVDPLAATKGRPVFGLWASPDCRDFSNAKGGKPRDKKIRSLAWVATRWLKAVRPEFLFAENVPEFEGWGPLLKDGSRCPARKGKTFRAWIARIRNLGYSVDWRVLDASHYGAPTKRRRLFIVARRDRLPICWPAATHGKGLLPMHTAAECIDWSLPCPSIFDRKKPLADKTLWRIAQGLRRFVFDAADPFVVEVNQGTAIAPVLQQSGYGERKGQRARALDIQEPLGTLMATGQKHALVAAFLARHFGDPLGPNPVVGADLRAPLPTVTARDHHSLAAITLAHFRGTANNQPGAKDVRGPLDTISAGGIHTGEVRAFLSAYYGSDGTGGQQLTVPMRTLTAKHRLGLVTVRGVEYRIVDIGFRMLEPHELLRAQFGRFADGYDLSAAKTKKDQVFLIGNSVAPECAEALVRANIPQRESVAA